MRYIQIIYSLIENLYVEKILSKTKNIRGSTERIIKFFEKTQVFNRTPKISKSDLSPLRTLYQVNNTRTNKTPRSNK